MSIPPKPEESDENNIFISYNNYNCSYINAKLNFNTTTTTLFGKDIIGIRPTIYNGTISSRDTGENVSFLEEYSTGVSDTSGPIIETLNYDVRKERRKAEVLQHNNNNNIVNYETKKNKFSYFMKYGKSKFPGTSEVCNSKYKVESVITSNSGIYGGRDLIMLNNIIDVQFFL